VLISGRREGLSREALAHLQRTAGNTAVSAALLDAEPGRREPGLQRKAIPSGVEEAELEQLDIESDSAMSSSMKAKAHATARGDKDKQHGNVTITNPNYVGGYEQAGADHPVPTIHVGSAARAAGGETLMQLQTDYNAYTPLLRLTLGAMGRLKDLDRTGAKLDPASLKSDPKLAAKFSPTRAGGDEPSLGFDAWHAAASDEKIAVSSMRAGFQQLRAAISGFRAAEGMLKRRQKQAQLETAKGKKEKIDQTVETLEKIVETSFKVYETAESIESFFEKPRDVRDLEEVEAKENYKETRSAQQSLGSAATVMGEKMKKHHKKVESWLKDGGLTFKNVLIFATGNAKEYEELTKQISQLQNDLAELGFDIETNQIRQADEQLQGMKLEIGVRIQAATGKRDQARKAARTYGHIMAGDEGALAMFAAQAYQDLAIDGGAADRLRETRIDPYLGWLLAFLKNNAYIALGHGWRQDWDDLQAWGQDMVEQRNFFSTHQPMWNEKAGEWNAFFEQLTGGPLVRR